jgi:hypothetical protein
VVIGMDLLILNVALPTLVRELQATASQLQSGPVTAHVKTSTESEVRQTANILADSKKGDPGNVVVVGAHLDSVLAGTGPQRQRQRLGHDPGDRRAADQVQDQQDPLCLVGS